MMSANDDDDEPPPAWGDQVAADVEQLIQAAEDAQNFTEQAREALGMLASTANSYMEAMSLLEQWADGKRPMKETKDFLVKERGE